MKHQKTLALLSLSLLLPTLTIAQIPGVSDVGPSHPCYLAVFNLDDKYGISVAMKDGKFHPESAMTSGEACLLSFKMIQTARKYFRGPDSKVGKAFYAGIKSRNTSPVKDFGALKRRVKGSFYDLYILTLAESWGAYIGENPLQIRPDAALTRQEARLFLTKVFGPQRLKLPWGGSTPTIMSQPVTRAEFVMMASDCMDQMVAWLKS